MISKKREIEETPHFNESVGSEGVSVYRTTNQLVLQHAKKKHNGSLPFIEKSSHRAAIILHSTKTVPHYRSNSQEFLHSEVYWR